MSYADVYNHADPEETDRLAALGDAINDGTFRRLARLGIRPDARGLDIDAGPAASPPGCPSCVPTAR